MKQEKYNNIESSFKRAILGFLVAVLITAILAKVYDAFDKNRRFFKQGETLDLNEYIDQGKDFPVGEFVSLDCNTPMGSYASQTHFIAVEEVSFDSGIDYYYLVLLDDASLMTIIVSDEEEVNQLDKAADAFIDYLQNYNASGSPLSALSPVTLIGRVEEMKGDDLIEIYQKTVAEMGYAADDPEVRYTVLNARAVRTERVLLYIVLPIAGVIVLLVLFVRWKRRVEASYAAQNKEA